MAKNKSNMKKFITGAVTATMVASAIAPVAAAETKNFEDIKDYAQETQDIINGLVAKGIITGTSDTTFSPGVHVKRGQVVKMLGRYLVEAGIAEAPADWNSKERFKDVPVDFSDQDLVKNAAIVFEAGVFTGDNGALKSGDTISRQNMAVVLDRAAKALTGESFVEHAAGKDSNVSDIDTAKASAQDPIKALNALGISSVEIFKPLNNVTRAQFATFLSNAIDVIEAAEEEEEVADAEVVSVSAINAKQIKVTFGSQVGDNADDAASYTVEEIGGAANAVHAVEVLSDGKTVILSLDNPYVYKTEVSVVVDGVLLKDSIKDKFPRFAQAITVHDTELPSIVSATAKTNTDEAQSVTVVLSEPIKNTAIFKVNGETVNPTAVPPANYTGGSAEEVATVYLLSGVELAAGGNHKVEIINAEDYADNASDDILTKTFTVAKDTEVATGKLQAVQDNKIKIVFDKAITGTSLSNVTFHSFDGTTFNPHTPDSITVVDGSKGKEWIFDLSTPAAGFYGTNDTTEDVLVRVQTGVVDTAGNQVKEFDGTVTLKQDTTGPSVSSVTFDKNSKGEVTKLYFNFDEVLSSTAGDFVTTIANTEITVLDKSTNTAVDFSDLFGGSNVASLASDNQTLVVDVDPASIGDVTSGTYEFTLVGGASEFVVKDAALANNPNKKSVQTVNFGAVTKEVKASSVTTDATYDGTAAGTTADPKFLSTTADDQNITVVYDKPVTAASAINPANYSIAGKALPADTVIEYTEGTRTATFTLPMDYIKKSDPQATIQIKNIKPVDSSYTFKTYSNVIVAIDNTRPVPTSSIISNGQGKLAFGEVLGVAAGTDVTADFTSLTVNGKEIDGGEYVVEIAEDTNTGYSVAMLTVDATEDDVDGFIYQFIDVDGDTNYDPTVDIMLRRATGTTAPASWANDNGIAKLNLSAVTSVELKTIATPLLILDDNGTAAGNSIKGNTVIKLK